MSVLERYQKLEKRAEELQAQITRSEVVRDQLMEQLAEFDVSSLAEAKKLLTKLERNVARAEKVFEQRVVKFSEQWEEFASDIEED